MLKRKRLEGVNCIEQMHIKVQMHDVCNGWCMFTKPINFAIHVCIALDKTSNQFSIANLHLV